MGVTFLEVYTYGTFHRILYNNICNLCVKFILSPLRAGPGCRYNHENVSQQAIRHKFVWFNHRYYWNGTYRSSGRQEGKGIRHGNSLSQQKPKVMCYFYF